MQRLYSSVLDAVVHFAVVGVVTHAFTGPVSIMIEAKGVSFAVRIAVTAAIKGDAELWNKALAIVWTQSIEVLALVGVEAVGIVITRTVRCTYRPTFGNRHGAAKTRFNAVLVCLALRRRDLWQRET